MDPDEIQLIPDRPITLPWTAKIKALRAQVEQLQRALKKYGQHTYECASHTSRDGAWLPCDCGWLEASTRMDE